MQMLQKWVLTLVVGALATVAGFGQAGGLNGQIEGTITDPTGALVPSVKVDVVNVNTSYKRSTTTDSSGFFRFALLPPGSYTVTTNVSGFGDAKYTDVGLS